MATVEMTLPTDPPEPTPTPTLIRVIRQDVTLNLSTISLQAAPNPDTGDPHYNGGSPLDGGESGTSLSAGPYKFSPVALEIGLILGSMAVIILGVVCFVYCRNRRYRLSKTSASTQTAVEDGQELSEPTVPFPIAKDDRPSTSGDNGFVPSDEHHHSGYMEGRPMATWNDWTRPSQLKPVEQHEIPSRI
ncbi:hypothetical protein F5Y16DRAFT_406570 [Xylariaceae sp. FL0255]|nr:hypothetical protein F5Y16DRAFT_406570 [Xylariaceae sp. FL0255]